MRWGVVREAVGVFHEGLQVEEGVKGIGQGDRFAFLGEDGDVVAGVQQVA